MPPSPYRARGSGGAGCAGRTGRQRHALSGPGPADTPADLRSDSASPTPSPALPPWTCPAGRPRRVLPPPADDPRGPAPRPTGNAPRTAGGRRTATPRRCRPGPQSAPARSACPVLPRGRAQPAALAAFSLSRRTTPADLHLVPRGTPPGRPAGEEPRGDVALSSAGKRRWSATRRGPPRPIGADRTIRWHTRTCPARQPTPRPLQTGGRSLRTCPTAPPATRGLTTRVAWCDRPPRRAGPGSRWRRWRGRRGRRGRGRGREGGKRGAARPSFRWPRGGQASSMTLAFT